MATSGSTNFAITRDEIILEALQLQGVVGDSATTATLSSDKKASMSRTLNLMVKHWQADVSNLFALQRTYLFLQKNTSDYALGSSSTRYAKAIGETTASVASAASATSVTTTDNLSAIIAASDYIGILTSDNTLHWSTVSSISSNTVNLTTALDNAVAAGAKIYYYTAANQMGRPMKILQGVRVENSGFSVPLTLMTRHEYVELSDKNADGDTVNVYYDPQIGAGTLRVWTQADDESQYLELWVQRTLEDFDAATDEPDFPQEWFFTLAFNLAKYTMPKQGVPRLTKEFIMAEAERLLMEAQGFDKEDVTFFEPDTRGIR